MIAWARVNVLRDEIGEEDFRDVVQLFLEEVGAAVEMLDPDLPPDEMGAALHFVKGSAMQLGFQQFVTMCETFERQLQTAPCERVDIDSLAEVYGRSRLALLDGLNPSLPAAG